MILTGEEFSVLGKRQTQTMEIENKSEEEEENKVYNKLLRKRNENKLNDFKRRILLLTTVRFLSIFFSLFSLNRATVCTNLKTVFFFLSRCFLSTVLAFKFTQFHDSSNAVFH